MVDEPLDEELLGLAIDLCDWLERKTYIHDEALRATIYRVREISGMPYTIEE